MYNAKSDIVSSLSQLSSPFAPMASGGLPNALLIDIITLGYMTAAAPMFNSFSKTLPSMRNLPDGTDINGVLKTRSTAG